MLEKWKDDVCHCLGMEGDVGHTYTVQYSAHTQKTETVRKRNICFSHRFVANSTVNKK